MALHDFRVSNSNPEVYAAAKRHLDKEVTYYHETENGLEVMLDDDENGVFGNEGRALADVIDAAGGGTAGVRRKHGW